MVERSPILRSAGQGVDVRDSAREIIRRMGLFDLIRARSSHEEGFEIVDRNSRALAKFEVDDSSGRGESVTCDIEILRGELAGILYDATCGDVNHIFGEEVLELREEDGEGEGEGGVWVTFKNGRPAERFDLVVAADGIGSRIRRMMMAGGSGSSKASSSSNAGGSASASASASGSNGGGTTDDPAIHSLQSYGAYFSIPRSPSDGMWAQSRSSPGGRFMMLRPDNQGRTRAFLGLVAYSPSDPRLALLAQVSRTGTPDSEKKRLMTTLFRDADWAEMPRILDGMADATDMYMQHIAQVRLDRWSSPRGRVAVVGDAGYAASPFAGMGTSLAFIGAYVLAGEVSRAMSQAGSGSGSGSSSVSLSKTIPAALDAYEKILRGYVESIQQLPPGIPWIICPQTSVGVWVLEVIVVGIGILTRTGIMAWLGRLGKWIPGGGRVEFKLPEYEAFRKED